MTRGEFLLNEYLITALRKGQKEAYEQVYRETFPSILSLVYLNNGQEHNAKDLLQEAVVVLFRKLQDPGFGLTCKVTTYLYSICRNKWLNQLRNERRKRNKSKADEFKDSLHDVEEYVDIPDQVDDDAQLLLENRIQTAFHLLAAGCKDILTKYYFYNQNLEEIAQSIQVSSAAVKVKKFRCIQKLKHLVRK